jgi:1-hydroxycarotenoid 3,4-desaturase
MLSKVYGERKGVARCPHVIVVGAGIGGLVSALLLAARGFAVTLVESHARPGGKLREVVVDGNGIDSGPTVFTMRWVFDAIFAAAGAQFDRQVHLTRADILARHSWEDGSTLDLHADRAAAADAIGRFAGVSEARGYLAFCRRTEEVFQSLNAPFMENASPSPIGLARSAGLGGLAALARIKPFTSLWKVTGSYFRDPRLRQLFGRYATYCGSSPFEAPGPLMLIAHVEQTGVWLVQGGMMRIPEALERVARAKGAVFDYGAAVAEVIVRDGSAHGVRLASGEVIACDAVVFNGDPAALFSGMLGGDARPAVAPWKAKDRSLSAVTWSLRSRASGFPLSRHTVFFSSDYRREFADILGRQQLPGDPTIYVCAQDRGASDSCPAPAGPERLLLLVNAPGRADEKPLSEAEIASCERRLMERLGRAGLHLSASPERKVLTTPADFAAMFPGSGGALYGRASHGWASSFQRPKARTPIRGLYLAGGAVHPGPGIPMAALSGRHAAEAVAADLTSAATLCPMATPGGTSTRSAQTATMR